MTKLINLNHFRGLFLATMSFLLHFNNTNAQTTIQQIPTVGDTTAILKEKSFGILNDTFYVYFQVAKSTNDTFKGAISEFTVDTLFGIDTSFKLFTVSLVDLFPGHLPYCSRTKIVSKVNGKIYYSNIEYWSFKGPLKKFDLRLDKFIMTDDGCIVTVDIENGRAVEKDTTFFEYKTSQNGKWRPTGIKPITTGTVKAVSYNLTGYGQNQFIYWRARGSNQIGGDTIYWSDTTNAQPGPPVIDLDSLFYTGANTGYGSYRVYSSNLKTIVWAMVKNVNTGKTDSMYLKTTKNNIQETFKFSFPTVGYKVRYEVTLWAWDSLGKTSSEMRWFITPDAPVATTINHVYSILGSGTFQGVFDYTIPANNEITRVDLKLWKNSSLSGPAQSFLVAQNLLQSGQVTTDPITLTKGVYWGYYNVDDIKGVWPKSDTFSFEIKFAVSINPISMTVDPTECKLYDLSGKLISESYNVDPKVNLFDSNLPHGILIAVPVKSFKPFRTFNHK